MVNRMLGASRRQTEPHLLGVVMALAQGAVVSQILSKRSARTTELNRTRIVQTQKLASHRAAAQLCKQRILHCSAQAQAATQDVSEAPPLPEADTKGMSAWLDGLKWDTGGLVAVIAQVQSTSPVIETA